MLSLDLYSIALDSGTLLSIAILKSISDFFFHCCEKNIINQLKIQFKVHSTVLQHGLDIFSSKRESKVDNLFLL